MPDWNHSVTPTIHPKFIIQHPSSYLIYIYIYTWYVTNWSSRLVRKKQTCSLTFQNPPNNGVVGLWYHLQLGRRVGCTMGLLGWYLPYNWVGPFSAKENSFLGLGPFSGYCSVNLWSLVGRKIRLHGSVRNEWSPIPTFCFPEGWASFASVNTWARKKKLVDLHKRLHCQHLPAIIGTILIQ